MIQRVPGVDDFDDDFDDDAAAAAASALHAGLCCFQAVF